MPDVLPRDILFRAGGKTLLRYGVLARRRGIPTRGGEEEKETFVRATSGSYVDRDGSVRSAGNNVLRVDWVDLDGDGVRETPGLLLEALRTNRALYSQDLSNWTQSGTPTLGTPLVIGDLSLDLAGDDDAAAQERFSRSYAAGALFGAGGPAAVAVYVKKGTSPAAGGSDFGIFDVTAAAYRLYFTLTWDGNNAPVIASVTGTYLGAVLLGNGVYRLLFHTLAVTVGNAHDIYFWPATVLAQTGNLYWGGLQVEDTAAAPSAEFPSSYNKTTAAAVTRNSDDASYTIAFGQRSLTILVDAYIVEWLDVASVGADNVALCMIRDSGYTNYLGLYRAAATYQFQLSHRGAGTGIQSFSANLPAATRRIKLLVQYDHAAKTVRIDPGTGVLGAATAISDAHSAPFTTLDLGSAQAPGERATGVRLLDVMVAAGLFTVAEMGAVP